MYNIKLYKFYIMSGIKINMNLHVLSINSQYYTILYKQLILNIFK